MKDLQAPPQLGTHVWILSRNDDEAGRAMLIARLGIHDRVVVVQIGVIRRQRIEIAVSAPTERRPTGAIAK